MDFFQLVFKQMRQRSLSTCLTLLSVTLGVALAMSVMFFQREGGAVGSSRVDLQACKLEYSIVSPK